MSKKIKNKILVNGKIFMPAKLNEEWLKEPARDEGLKEIYNDNYFISLIPEGCKYFAIDEKNEKIYGLGFNYKEKMEKQIADLEAKLAESEKKKKDFKTMYFNKCLDYEHLHEKFDDKCAEFELKEYDYKQTIFEKDQDKILFAVEQLEKVKKELEFTSNNNEWITARDDRILNGICNYIDNQIEELKKEMK